MIRLLPALLLAATALAASTNAYAACETFSLSGEAEPKFVDGAIVAISATGVSKVRGEDPTQLATAMKSASLKARGALVRYMSQDVTADQLLESQNSFEETTTNGATSVNQVDMERTAEVIRSKAGDIIKGATPVAECYDDARDLAFVKIGVSDAIVAALKSFENATRSGTTSAPAPAAAASPSGDKSFEKHSANAGLFE